MDSPARSPEACPVLSVAEHLPALLLEEDRPLRHDLARGVPMVHSHMVLPTQSSHQAGSDVKHTTRWVISCSLINVCVIIREPAEGMEKDVTATKRQKHLLQPRHPGTPQSFWPLPVAGLYPTASFPTSAGLIRSGPVIPTPSSALQSTWMSQTPQMQKRRGSGTQPLSVPSAYPLCRYSPSW